MYLDGRIQTKYNNSKYIRIDKFFSHKSLFLYFEYKMVLVFKPERLQNQPMGQISWIVLCTSSDFRCALFRLCNSPPPKTILQKQ